MYKTALFSYPLIIEAIASHSNFKSIKCFKLHGTTFFGSNKDQIVTLQDYEFAERKQTRYKIVQTMFVRFHISKSKLKLLPHGMLLDPKVNILLVFGITLIMAFMTVWM